MLVGDVLSCSTGSARLLAEATGNATGLGFDVPHCTSVKEDVPTMIDLPYAILYEPTRPMD